MYLDGGREDALVEILVQFRLVFDPVLELGEGPFPLPIGQAKEDVKKMFDVEIIPAAEGDPAGTIRNSLKVVSPSVGLS